MLGAGVVLALDLSSIKNFPAGLDLRKIQNLMRIVDPKTCGCARPEQHCEVPVPEARFVGFTCKIGTFCCRMKKQPGRPNLKDFQRFLPTQQSQSPGQNTQQFTRPRPPPHRQGSNNKKNQNLEKENSWSKETTVHNQPIYNHNVIKTEETKEKVDEIEPHHLGLPKGKLLSSHKFSSLNIQFRYKSVHQACEPAATQDTCSSCGRNNQEGKC